MTRKQPEDRSLWWCRSCGGDGASWLPTGPGGTRWTVRNVRPRDGSPEPVCDYCADHPGHGLRAVPTSPYMFQANREAA